MPTIVEQLQADALRADIPTSTLLRKVKLAAVKLKLPNVEAWVDLELNGYDSEPPEYRIKMGLPRAKNPYRGWMPINGPAQFITLISRAFITQPISSIESLVADETNGMVYLPYGPEKAEILNQMSSMRWAEMGIELSRGQMAEILDRVRTLVLDWALELERQGILGTEIGFDAREKERAQNRSVHIHINSIGSFTGSLTSAVEGENSRLNIAGSDRSRNKARR